MMVLVTKRATNVVATHERRIPHERIEASACFTIFVVEKDFGKLKRPMKSAHVPGLPQRLTRKRTRALANPVFIHQIQQIRAFFSVGFASIKRRR